MKKNYFFLLAILFLGAAANAQTVVNVAPGEGTLEAAIEAAGVEAGNYVFTLQRGGEYITIKRIWKDESLTIVAEEGTGDRPIIKPLAEKERPFQPAGNLTLKGLHLIGVNDDGLGQSAIIRSNDPVTITIDDCHFEKNSSGAIRVDAAATIVITNSIFSNFTGSGNLTGENTDLGGACVIQDKADNLKSLSVSNSTFYNIAGNIFQDASLGVKENIVFDHCTMVNVGGTGFELGQAVNCEITNNQFINFGFAGSDNLESNIYVIELTAIEGTAQTAIISNNNIYIDPALISALPDTVNAVVNFNATAASFVDDATTLNENVVFITHPAIYSAATGWDLSTTGDFGYDKSLASYTGGTDGSLIGDTNWEYFGEHTSVRSFQENKLEFACYPNPIEGFATISFLSNGKEFASIDVLSITGAVVKTIYQGKVNNGKNSFNLDVNDLNPGLYFARLNLNGSIAIQKIIIK